MGRKANPERGEHSLVLAGKRYVLRPTITALIAIEQDTGKAIIELIRLAGSGALTIRQLGIIGAELIRAGAGEGDAMAAAVDAERISEMIFEQGLPGAHAVFSLCLADAARGGRTTTGEAKAAPAKPTSRPAGAASSE